MGFRLSVLAGVTALASAACAPTLRGPVFGDRGRLRTSLRAARADFKPMRFEEIFAKAVDLVRESGLEIDSCEAWRGALSTAPVEFDARCGGSTCLARETTRVKLGFRRASVTVKREVWDTALRAWREQNEHAAIDDISHEEHELLSQMILARTAGARSTQPRDPCARSQCADDSCLAVSATPIR